MTEIYLVQGETGEYDNLRSWIVAAFSSRAAAEEYAERLSVLTAGLRRCWDDDEELPAEARALDPRIEIDSNGVSYAVLPVELDPIRGEEP